jgi:hypothetical protein
MPREFADDLSIPHDAILLRRIHPVLARKARVDERGLPILTTEMFQDASAQEAERRGLPGPCMSVGLDSSATTAEQMISGEYEGYGIAELPVSAVRNLGTPPGKWSQGIMRDPTEAEPWHCVVFSKTTAKKTGGMQKALRDAARWRTYPEQPA